MNEIPKDQINATLGNITAQANKLKDLSADTLKNSMKAKAMQRPPTEAPRWLVFSDVIINCDTVIGITKQENAILVACRDQKFYTIPVSDVNAVFLKLQKAFTYGVTADEQNVPSPVQENK